MGKLSAEYVLNSFIIGLRFDARLSAVIVLPYLLLSPLPFVKGERMQKIWNGYWIILFILILGFYIADIGFYAYLNTRLDATIIGLVKNFQISLLMIWESYPVILVSIFITAAILIFYKIIARIQSLQNEIQYRKSKAIPIYFLTIFIFIGRIFKITW